MSVVYIHNLSDEHDEWCVWVDGSSDWDDEYYESEQEAREQADSIAAELNCKIKLIRTRP